MSDIRTKLLRNPNQWLAILRECDVILKNGEEEFIGLYYDSESYDIPFVTLKGNWNFDYYFTKLAERMGIPCLEQKLLVRLLYSKTEEFEPVPGEYYLPVARVYSGLKKFQPNNDENSFLGKLNHDIGEQLHSIEKKISKDALRKLRAKNFCKGVFNGNVPEYFKTELQDLVEKYELDYKTVYNPVFKVYEYYLSFSIDNSYIKFWQMVLISEVEGRIFFGSPSLIKEFDFDDVEKALATIKTLVITYNTGLKKDATIFKEEFDISPRHCEIAKNSIMTLLELNYNENHYDYGYDVDNLCYIQIYLKKIKPEKKAVQNNPYVEILMSAGEPTEAEDTMYELLITYKEFLHAPEAFREFIKHPKQMEKWNFWCKESRYNKKYFTLKH